VLYVLVPWTIGIRGKIGHQPRQSTLDIVQMELLMVTVLFKGSSDMRLGTSGDEHPELQFAALFARKETLSGVCSGRAIRRSNSLTGSFPFGSGPSLSAALIRSARAV
jgi:hypothetical protein